MKFCFLLIMLFCHVVDDYYLQGCLAQMKQYSWWRENVPRLNQSIYKNDYLMALLVHAFSWTFVVMLPAMVLMFVKNYFGGYLIAYTLLFIINLVIHFVTDELKANLFKINLITDQVIHFIQVFMTWLILFVILSI